MIKQQQTKNEKTRFVQDNKHRTKIQLGSYLESHAGTDIERHIAQNVDPYSVYIPEAFIKTMVSCKIRLLVSEENRLSP